MVTKAHNVYISNVDHTLNTALPSLTPSLQLIGSNRFSGAFHSYSLETPDTLTAISDNYFGSGYTHDGASINITDSRKDNQCNAAGDSCTVFIDFNEKEMKLWNITDTSNTTLLGTGEYNDVAKSNQYVHSGWGTEDKQHIFLHDEFDEKDGGIVFKDTKGRKYSLGRDDYKYFEEDKVYQQKVKKKRENLKKAKILLKKKFYLKRKKKD